MRKGVGTIAWVAWAFLMLAMTARCGNPLGPAYTPHHYELVVFGATLYILAAYLVARVASPRALARAMAGAVALLVIAAGVWCIYHAGYGAPPLVQDWDSLVAVTPFHVQLAVPAFVGLAGGTLVLAIALRVQPSVTLNALTS